jgi:hypothetical protein
MSCGTIALLFHINACVVFHVFCFRCFFSLYGCWCFTLGAVCFSFFFPVSNDVYRLLLSFWNDVVLSAFQVPYAFSCLLWHLLVHNLFILLHLQLLLVAQLPAHLQKLHFPPMAKYISYASRAVIVFLLSCFSVSIPINSAVRCGIGSNSSRP